MPQPRCCANLTSRLHAAEGDLRTAARRAAFHSSKGRDITKLKQAIIDNKASIARIKKAMVDHEAEHAAEGQVA